jgi:hypothetical protein
MRRFYCQSVPWLQKKKKIDIPPILPIDLTRDYESNTISIVYVKQAGRRASLASNDSKVKSGP